MKKLITIMLIMLLSFSAFGCGNRQDNNLKDNDKEINNEKVEIKDSGEDIPDVIIPNGYAENENDEADQYGIEYQLDLKVKEKFALDNTVEKEEKNAISKMGSVLENKLSNSLNSISIGTYEIIFNEYEEFEGDDIDKQAYVAALEDNDAEKGHIETGMYHNSRDNKYHQYIYFVSENIYDINKENIKPILDKIENSFGVTLSVTKVEKALKEAINIAKDEDYASLYSKKTIENKDYTEVITASAEASAMEDDSIIAYIYIDRDRIYN